MENNEHYRFPCSSDPNQKPEIVTYAAVLLNSTDFHSSFLVDLVFTVASSPLKYSVPTLSVV